MHLLDVGDMPGTPAGELAKGDRLMWNYGSVYEVVTVRGVSPGPSWSPSGAAGTAGSYTRRLRKDRLVVRAQPGERLRGRDDPGAPG